jgi:membrane-bound lytic murein transglycosylase F
VRLLAIVVLCLLLGTCSPHLTMLEQVQRGGVLRVVTRSAPTAFYLGPDGPAGPEYELARSFAEHLGVELDMYTIESVTQIPEEVLSGRAHLAAAALTIPATKPDRLEFGPPYREVTQQLVYRQGAAQPRNLPDTYGRRLEVVAGGSSANILEMLRIEAPGLTWIENPAVDVGDLLARVSGGELDFTVADSTAVQLNRFFHPDIRTAFDLSDPMPVAWVFRGGRDLSLLDEARHWFAEPATDNLVAALFERYFGHAERFDYVGTRNFLRHVETRLPRYRAWFEEAAAEHGLDWRLLAALSYQESHWDPRAVSPTGVRGLMMLTQRTAEAVGVTDREDPEQSIRGGARYLRKSIERIPERIPEPDRTWMALAAYNVGYAHLEDARRIAQIRGLDPDRWQDVRDSLPLLTQERWYRQTRHGYTRGWEPVRFVDNIRRYHQVMNWITADSVPALARAERDSPDAQRRQGP